MAGSSFMHDKIQCFSAIIKKFLQWMTKKNEGLHMVKLHMGLTINVTSINMIFLNFIVIYKNLQLQCGIDVVSNLH